MAAAIDRSALDELRTLVDGDPDALSLLIDTFLREAEQLLDRLDAAAEARDAAALGQAAHYLRSGALSLGADTVAGVCYEIERLAAAGDVEHSRLLRRSLRVHQRRAALECQNLLQAAAAA